jgi:hypothetical protein
VLLKSKPEKKQKEPVTVPEQWEWHLKMGPEVYWAPATEAEQGG